MDSVSSGSSESSRTCSASQGQHASSFRIHATWFLLAAVLALPATTHASAGKDGVDYWKNNYELLSASSDPRVSRAHAIFTRLLGVTGATHGVLPRLLVIQDKSLRIIALPDGWVVLSSGALEQCYRNTALGDDRLAFVLGHEIAHHLKDDFWHMRFFEAVSAYEKSPNAQSETLRAIRSIAEKADEVRAKELAADERAIVYAAMAGFNPRAVVSEDQGLNFFAEWVAALDPGRFARSAADATHPDPDQRAQAVKLRLASVLDHLAAFELGVWFYEAGLHEQAISSWREFAVHFPGREVNHDLSLAHYQLALDAYREWKAEPLFAVSVRLDPQTRAEDLRSRGGEPPEPRFRQHIADAIRLAQAAIEQDPAYAKAYHGLAAALILDARPYEAVGILQRAIKHTGPSAESFSLLGVAFQQAGDPMRAGESFAAAQNADPHYAIVLYNQGRAAWLAGDKRAAAAKWRKFLQHEPAGYWSDQARRALGQSVRRGSRTQPGTQPEAILGFTPGMYLEEAPKTRLPQSKAEVRASELPYLVLRYADGLATVTYDDRIVMVNSPANHAGKSARGVAVGNKADKLTATYGTPDSIQMVGDMIIWTYRKAGIAFRLKEDVIQSWLLFQPRI